MWLHDPQTFPELESLDFTMPQRSRLYRPVPMGAEAGQIEGQLSYLVRLARAHSVNPRRLVRTVFASDNLAIRQLKYAGFFSRGAGTINGLGKYAELFQEETGQLTGACFLRHMSLLPLKELLPPNGAGLLAPKPRWCPCCVGEMVESGDDVYRPLAWSFDLYRVCVRHGMQLQDTCGHCGRHQPFIPRYPDLGRCDHCGGMLANSEQQKSSSRLDLWASKAITNIVQHLPALDGIATVSRFVAFLKAAVARFSDGNRAEFCERIGMPPWALKGWLSDGERPTLPQLLSVCYGLGIMPSKLFLEPEDILPSMRDSLRPVPEKLFGRAERPMLSVRARRKLAKDLDAIINNPEDVRSLPVVVKSLGFTQFCLKYWFPVAYASIQDKHESARKLRMAIRAQSERDAVVSVVRLMRERGEYPSRRKVNTELLKQKMSLIRPELMQIYRQAIAGIQE
ncbi:MAG: TniQ family protein [Gammaproteobacteria bacterium]|nr:TniQ family protein [Gammaproteobacteria bacterium]